MRITCEKCGCPYEEEDGEYRICYDCWEIEEFYD